jgi:hypothetical protein
VTTNTSIHADELRPGDLLEYDGQAHRITEVRRCAGSSWPVASDGTGWAIALGRKPVRVWRDRCVAVAS